MNVSNTNIPTSLAVVFGFLILLLLPFDKVFVLFELGEFKENHLGDSLKNIVIILFGIIMIKRFRYIRVSGIANYIPRNSSSLIFPLYFLLLGPLQYYSNPDQFANIDWVNMLILFLSMITVGLSEEVIFRGFVMPNLIQGSPSSQSLIVPILTSSLLFGVLHFLNLFQAEKQFLQVLSQVIYATMFGVAFGILLLRTGSILPLGLLHGLINFSSSLDNLPNVIEPVGDDAYSAFDAIIAILVVTPFFIYALRQLPKINRNEVRDLFGSNE